MHGILVLHSITKYPNCGKNKKHGRMAVQTVERRCYRDSYWWKVENHCHIWHYTDFLRLDISTPNSLYSLHSMLLLSWSSHFQVSFLSTEKLFVKMQKKCVCGKAYMLSIVRRVVSYQFVLTNRHCLDSDIFKTVMGNYQALGWQMPHSLA